MQPLFWHCPGFELGTSWFKVQHYHHAIPFLLSCTNNRKHVSEDRVLWARWDLGKDAEALSAWMSGDIAQQILIFLTCAFLVHYGWRNIWPWDYTKFQRFGTNLSVTLKTWRHSVPLMRGFTDVHLVHLLFTSSPTTRQFVYHCAAFRHDIVIRIHNNIFVAFGIG